MINTEIRPGDVIASRYEVTHLLGRRMLKAHDRTLEIPVSLRVIHWAFFAREYHHPILLKASEKAREVRHRNVRAMYEYGGWTAVDDTQAEPLSYFVLEYLTEVVDLQTILDAQGPRPPDEAWAVAIELADGAQAVHDHDLLVRQLDPGMILRDEKGTFRLDFTRDMIRYAEAPAPYQTTGVFKAPGDIAFTSPEAWGFGKSKPGPGSDVWSLALVIFAMFTGRALFHGANPHALAIKIAVDPLPPLNDVRLPQPLIPLLTKALSRDIAARFSSMREFGEALRAAAALA